VPGISRAGADCVPPLHPRIKYIAPINNSDHELNVSSRDKCAPLRWWRLSRATFISISFLFGISIEPSCRIVADHAFSVLYCLHVSHVSSEYFLRAYFWISKDIREQSDKQVFFIKYELKIQGFLCSCIATA
jgi:hypothetical protein